MRTPRPRAGPPQAPTGSTPESCETTDEFLEAVARGSRSPPRTFVWNPPLAVVDLGATSASNIAFADSPFRQRRGTEYSPVPFYLFENGR